jgi:acyl carrier protein
MTDFEDVFEKVKDSLVDSCGIDKNEIELDKTLMDDLGIDSIDLIDLVYTLEKQYTISLEIGDFARMAAKELGDVPFEKDNVITDGGLELLKEWIGESQHKNIQKGLTVQEIPFLFTVQSICILVRKKLAEKDVGEERSSSG